MNHFHNLNVRIKVNLQNFEPLNKIVILSNIQLQDNFSSTNPS